MFVLHEIIFEGQKFAQCDNFMQFSLREKKSHKRRGDWKLPLKDRSVISNCPQDKAVKVHWYFYCCCFLHLLQHLRWNSGLVDAVQVTPSVFVVLRQNIIVYPGLASNSPSFRRPPKCWDYRNTQTKRSQTAFPVHPQGR